MFPEPTEFVSLIYWIPDVSENSDMKVETWGWALPSSTQRGCTGLCTQAWFLMVLRLIQGLSHGRQSFLLPVLPLQPRFKYFIFIFNFILYLFIFAIVLMFTFMVFKILYQCRTLCQRPFTTAHHSGSSSFLYLLSYFFDLSFLVRVQVFVFICYCLFPYFVSLYTTCEWDHSVSVPLSLTSFT